MNRAPRSLVLAASLIGLAACRSRASRPAPDLAWASCACAYVTDTDVPGSLAVEACVAPSDDAPEAARRCALASGVGAVETCACGARSGACAPVAACREAAGGAR